MSEIKSQTYSVGTLSTQDVKSILKKHLAEKGYADAVIDFDIKMETDPDDTFASRPSSPVFKGCSFKSKPYKDPTVNQKSQDKHPWD